MVVTIFVVGSCKGCGWRNGHRPEGAGVFQDNGCKDPTIRRGLVQVTCPDHDVLTTIPWREVWDVA